MDFDAINPLYIFAGLLCLALLIWVLRRAGRMPYYACDALLTPSELRFYKVLKQATPKDMAIMMKVRLADIINCDESDWHRGWGPRISAKHIDFVLINLHTTDIHLCIELDDSTHRTQKARVDRDAFVDKALGTASVPLLRINVQKYYDADAIRTLISQSIGLGQRQR